MSFASVMNRTRYRQGRDFWRTPAVAIWPLLARIHFDRVIWEPAAGDGDISKILIDAGYSVISTDIAYGGDFLQSTHLQASTIITNPPFRLALQFAQHAHDLNAKTAALLLPLSFLSGVGRARFLRDHRPARILVFGRRIPFGRGTENALRGGITSFCWVVWQGWTDCEQTKIEWIEPQPKNFSYHKLVSE